MALGAEIGSAMNEQQAREILGSKIQPNDDLQSNSPYLSWRAAEDVACLDDTFSADDLEAIAWWMRNKAKKI
jgi:hypothetical protein